MVDGGGYRTEAVLMSAMAENREIVAITRIV
jgi:hypothetical protein